MSAIARSRVAFLSVVLFLVACDSEPDERQSIAYSDGATLHGVVVDYVKDGDSFTALHKDRKIEVRLFGIDAPERRQPYAKESRLAAVTALGTSTLTLVVKDTDRYQRVVAEVFVENREVSVNEQLVAQGAVWVYRKYSKAPALLAAEASARNNHIGLWSLAESDRVAPWLWRERTKN